MKKAIIFMLSLLLIGYPQQYYDRNCDEFLTKMIALDAVAKVVKSEASNKTDSSKPDNSDSGRLLGLLMYKSCKDREPKDPIYNFVNGKN